MTFHTLAESAFLRHNVIFLAGAIAVGGLNYLFYPIVGRLLEPSSFGEVQVLISLFLQLTIFLTVLSLVTVNITANYQNKTNRNEVLYELEKIGLFISLMLLAATIILSEPLKHFLHFDSSLSFILLAIALVITVPFTFRSSYLRGQHKFAKTSLANLISAGGKLAFAVLFIVAGLGTAGAIIGLVVAQLVAFLYARHQAFKDGLLKNSSNSLWQLPKFKLVQSELRYSMFVFIGSLAIMILFSIDVIIVKHFFDAHTAGLYAGIATVARIIFFVTASVAQVMLPSVKIEQSKAKNLQLLIKSSILLGCLSLPLVIIFAIAPQFFVSILMGDNYLPYASLLPQLSFAVFITSILNLIVSYYLALRNYTPGILAMIGTFVTSVFMVIHHETLQSIVTTLLYGTAVIAFVIFAWAFYQQINRRTT